MRIVSGGQTGVDRAGLDVAIALGLKHGGWCPRGRLAENGRIPRRYRLQETISSSYAVRTEKNVAESDGTLILCRGPMSGGTQFTYRMTQKHGRPCLCVDLEQPISACEVRQWIRDNQIEVLNIAGPRESTAPGIRDEAYEYLGELLSQSD